MSPEIRQSIGIDPTANWGGNKLIEPKVKLKLTTSVNEYGEPVKFLRVTRKRK